MTKKKDLSLKIMSKIKKERIPIRSRYLVLAEKLGLGGGLALVVLISVFLVNLIFYWLVSTGNLQFLNFGQFGILAFLESFPYPWLGFSILFLVLASFLLKKYDISYRRPYLLIISGGLFLVLVLSFAVAASGINERIAIEVDKGRLPLIKPFYPGHGQGFWCRSGLIGRILVVRDSQLDVASRAKLFKLLLTSETVFYGDRTFEEGDWVRAVGREKEGSFEVSAIKKVMTKEPLHNRPMLRRFFR